MRKTCVKKSNSAEIHVAFVMNMFWINCLSATNGELDVSIPFMEMFVLIPEST